MDVTKMTNQELIWTYYTLVRVLDKNSSDITTKYIELLEIEMLKRMDKGNEQIG
jgi:hypothetical protein